MTVISPAPTYADPVLIDEETKKARFNPIWLRWFLDLTQQTNTAVGTVTHTSGALTANQLVIGVGGADIAALGSLGATTQFLQGNAAGAPTWETKNWVTSVAQSFTGGLISVSGSPITSSGTLALTVAGTSGGIPYFSGEIGR